MAEIETVSFGADLYDGFKAVDKWISNCILFMDDVQSFYRERAQLEKEHATKLQTLTAKYFDRKAKKSASLSVGDNPQMTPGSLECASLVTWNEILSQTENIAKEKDRLANELQLQIADQIKGTAIRFDAYIKRYSNYANNLIEDRDSYYTKLKHEKQEYDSICQSVENYRVKAQRDGTKSKNQKYYLQATEDMNNTKNGYLITVNVCNRVKDKYFHTDIPRLLNDMQDFNESRIKKLNGFWTSANDLELACLERCTTHLKNANQMVSKNDPKLDSAMFLKHNVGGWTEPADFLFEPSPIWHDDDQMITDAPSMALLRNRLAISSRNEDELSRNVSDRKAGIDSLDEQKRVALKDQNEGNYEEILGQILTAQDLLIKMDNKRLAAVVEREVTQMAVGDLPIDASPHNFKTASFRIPTKCDYCSEMIWGIQRHGFTCKDCGINVHTKCQLKVPANCSGTKVSRKDFRKQVRTVSNSASNSNLDSDSGSIIPNGHDDSFSLSPSSTNNLGNAPINHSAQQVRALYNYEPNTDEELAIFENELLTLVEPDDGSGWIVVTNSKSEEGIVPTSYVKFLPTSSAASNMPTRNISISSTINSFTSNSARDSQKKKGPAVAPRKGAKKLKYVVALYDYTARSDAELSIHEGDKILVTGDDMGDGWTEGELNGSVGSFPSNYVEETT